MKIASSTILVTGGASGLGEACVRRFAGLGSSVVIVDTNEEQGQQLAESLGNSVTFVKADVRKSEEVEKAVERAIAQYGTLHGLIACAGIAPAQKMIGKEGAHPLELFQKVLDINLVGTFNAIRAASNVMHTNEANAAGERGVLITTASIAAYEGQIGQAAYAASKGGIVSMTLPLARELARYGIRVMTIAPGVFATPLYETLPPQVVETLEQQVPFPSRLGQPDEYAQLAQQIFENSMLNGTVIRLDGAIRMGPK